MKKIVLIFLVTLFSYPFLYSQVKNYIPVVKPVLYENTIKTFENVANKFEQKNHKDLAEIFRSFARGGHGSGFVFVDSDGENYIITNRHVVANSEFVNLEFSSKGSTKTVYESCPIVYSDDNIDLAVVKFPDNEKVFTKSFNIASEKQSDGQEIWSAGFPGLMGKPMWQFSKGNVTNEEAYIDQLLAPEISYLIQHSASIDPGNSGGPLLVKEAGADEYSVVGVNTWTITNRQNTFFAIPSKNIAQLIKNAKEMMALKNNKDELRASLNSAAKMFAAEINSDKPNWEKVINAISYDYVGSSGWESFIRVLNEGDEETLKRLETKFFDYSPIEAMRYSILLRIWKKFHHSNSKNDLVFVAINPSDNALTEKKIRTKFTIDGEAQEFEWSFEHGHWRISNYDLTGTVGKKEKNTYSYDAEPDQPRKPGETGVYFGLSVFANPYNRHFNSTLDKNFNIIGAGGMLTLNFKARAALFVRATSLSFNNEMRNRPEQYSSARAKFLHITNGISIYMGNGKLRPYLSFGFNYLKYTESASNADVTVDKKFERFGTTLGFGMRYKINKRFNLFVDATLNNDRIFLLYLLDEDFDYTDLSNVQTAVGFTFNLRK
jgi:hypothetical protein